MCTEDTKLRWFQSRINHKILGTNSNLYKLKIVQDPNSSFGCNEIETIEHILWECVYTQTLLMELDHFLENNNIVLGYNKETLILGLHQAKTTAIPDNIIPMNIKYYVYKTKLEKKMLSLPSLLNYLNLYFQTIKLTAITSGK